MNQKIPDALLKTILGYTYIRDGKILSCTMNRILIQVYVDINFNVLKVTFSSLDIKHVFNIYEIPDEYNLTDFQSVSFEEHVMGRLVFDCTYHG